MSMWLSFWSSADSHHTWQQKRRITIHGGKREESHTTVRASSHPWDPRALGVTLIKGLYCSSKGKQEVIQEKAARFGGQNAQLVTVETVIYKLSWFNYSGRISLQHNICTSLHPIDKYHLCCVLWSMSSQESPFISEDFLSFSLTALKHSLFTSTTFALLCHKEKFHFPLNFSILNLVLLTLLLVYLTIMNEKKNSLSNLNEPTISSITI